MIGLLARRTLTDRPRRTAFFLIGFGISVGVMITLLSIGEAVLEQARDKDVVGGGDLVLLPEGVDVEVMKVGGATGMFFALDNARFVYRQVLSGPRYAAWMDTVPAPQWPGQAASPPLAAASPELVGKLVYARKWSGGAAAPAKPRRALASGVIPSLERRVRGPAVSPAGAPLAWHDSHADRMWMEPPLDSLYDALDRFHLPPPGQPGLDRWAEWLYFNFAEPQRDRYGFVSLIAAGDLAADKGWALPQVQIAPPGRAPRKFAGALPLSAGGISTRGVDLQFGTGTRAAFRDGAWRLRLDWPSALGRVRGDLVVRPVLDLYFPPFLIHSSPRFVSGYAVPAIRATLSGWIEAGGTRLDLDGVPGYHDHNWGTWRNVHWDWGTASTPEYGLFYGRVEHPELRPGQSGSGVFLLLSQARQPGRRGGFLGLFRPRDIEYTWREAPPLPGRPARLPRSIELRAAHDPPGGTPPEPGDEIRVHVDVTEVVSNPPEAALSEPDARGRPTPPGAPLGSPLDETESVFLQLRGHYRVSGRIGGREVAFETSGFAEVFVPVRQP